MCAAPPSPTLVRVACAPCACAPSRPKQDSSSPNNPARALPNAAQAPSFRPATEISSDRARQMGEANRTRLPPIRPVFNPATIKKNENIWNKDAKEYHKKSMREAAWNQVCEELVPGWKELTEENKNLKFPAKRQFHVLTWQEVPKNAYSNKQPFMEIVTMELVGVLEQGLESVAIIWISWVTAAVRGLHLPQ
ncbi:hypothetical protein MSG28_015718 [Choristoneura fumiferana]|uniref:Uncharacterized protein n=1 Tax=Choristoneura fumiferana TaxID=7141 RepID=A0ACC0KC03_CHOFU|nr:hypothetical protein MSG28_015718 [Choristoneura fumiferana]